jgi:putative ABC transport system permease protein
MALFAQISYASTQPKWLLHGTPGSSGELQIPVVAEAIPKHSRSEGDNRLWKGGPMSDFAGDFKHSIRMFRNSPGFTATVGPGFFDAFQIPVKRGRPFTARDDEKSAPVVIINEAMAKQFWKNDDPLKDRIAIGRGIMREFKDEPVRQIVGIVGDIHSGSLNVDPRPTMYVPLSQLPDAASAFFGRLVSMTWVARTEGDPHRLAPVIQEQVRQVTGLPVTQVRSMDEVLSLSTARQRFNMLLMAVFGAMALLLAAIGIYGLMAYSVAQRTHEIGIRLALGADGSQVRNMVVKQGMGLALAGVAAGLAAAWALARLIESLLFGVKARDPLVFIAVPIVLALVALLAVWLPANRAWRVSPIESLRYE